MLAMLGMYVQALVTGKGPVSNWLEHLADPSSANGFAFATKFAPTLLARPVAARLRSPPPSLQGKDPSRTGSNTWQIHHLPTGSPSRRSSRRLSSPGPSPHASPADLSAKPDQTRSTQGSPS